MQKKLLDLLKLFKPLNKDEKMFSFLKRKKEKSWLEGVEFAEAYLKSANSICQNDVYSLFNKIGSKSKREFLEPRGLEVTVWNHNKTPFVEGVLAYVYFIKHKIKK